MKLLVALALALHGATALVAPRRSCPNVAPSAALPTRVPEVFEGVHLPDRGLLLGRGTLLGTVLPTIVPGIAKDIVSFVLDSGKIAEMVGNPKLGAGPLGYDENVQEWWKIWKSDATDMPDPDLPESFKVFGGENFAAQLVTYLESNPFYAAALTVSGDGFEVKTFDEAGGEPTNHFMKVMAEMNDSRGRPDVNVKFSVKPGGGLEIESMRVREDGSADVVTADPKDWDHYATALIYELLYFSSAEHATIHVLHYLLTNALRACTHSWSVPELNAWADEYVEEIPIKYVEVGALLISEKVEGTAAITGEGGLGGSPDVIPLLEDRLDAWGQSATADEFLEKGWLSAPRAALEKAGVLTEFFKHVDLGVEFSKAVSAAEDPEKLAGVESDLGKFCGNCGKWKSSLSSLETWIQLMVTTGVIHGGTLSYTRCSVRGAILRWRNSESAEWEDDDRSLVQTFIGTMVGMQGEKHVMGSQKGRLVGKNKPITKGPLQDVFDEYNTKQLEMKEAYYKKIKAREDFDDVGFILTDYCPTGTDGKQLTMATYI